ncbi:MAG TPA: phosphatidylglycerol lysyltransferase domain-containing protein [Actinocrinis sp.]|uniref:phosphatidylglycerol lysyltransferase domain-containing protein n=1 Tax=Actinocrinis sp. TaxID=1920516 RepID=UPI002D665812|nr:phosphatidylglycerol lysyltransferase domain-containing protein [Actinocrinis sp.]HZU55933.1 phosphatidylglycerol lysyltransferase domain-containing protein [Actinocrinis sp.]
MLVSGRSNTAVWPFAAVFALSGVVLVSYAAAEPPAWLDRTTVTVCGTAPSASHALLLGLVLLTLAHGLSRRRRVDWVLGLGLVAWSTLTEAESLVTRAPGEPWRLVPLSLMVVSLVRARDRFAVSPDPHRLRQTAAMAGASSVTLILVGGGGLFAERGRFAAPVSATDVGREFVAAVAANSGRVDFQGPSWLLPGLALASGLALIAVLATLSAAAPPPDPADPDERAAMRSLIAHRDSGTLAPFALRYDKSYVFEPTGRAAIGYRVLAGMAMVGGDPIGARDSWPAAMDAFMAEAERRGWRPAVLGAGPEARELWAQRGMRGFGIGDEVVIDVESFSLHGRAMRNVRQAVQRTEHAGIWVSVVPERELSPELSAQLRRIHRAWLGRGTTRRPRPDADMIPQGREHGFAMNLDAMAEGRHPDSLFVIAFAADGYAVSFQRYLVAAQDGARPVLSLDVMPRHRIAPNGVNERLIVAAVEYAAAHGFKTVSLNFAAFRTVLEAYRLGAATARTAPAVVTEAAATAAAAAPVNGADKVGAGALALTTDATGTEAMSTAATTTATSATATSVTGTAATTTAISATATSVTGTAASAANTTGADATGTEAMSTAASTTAIAPAPASTAAPMPAPPGLVARTTRRAIHLMDPLIQLESLYRFNAKFRPGWLPRAVLVASWLDLPLFGIAAFGLEFALPYDRRRSRITAPELENRPNPAQRHQPQFEPATEHGPGESDSVDQVDWSAVQRHPNRS